MSSLRDLRQLVLEERLLEPGALAEAVRGASASGTPLAQHLVQSGLVSDDALVRTLRRRLGLPATDLAQLAPEHEALRLVPHEIAERCRALPLAVLERGPRRVLRVAVIDPLDVQVVDELAQASGCSLELVVASPTRLVQAIERCYRDLVTRLIPRRRSVPPGVIPAVLPTGPAPSTVQVSSDTLENIPTESDEGDAPPEPAAPPRFVEVTTRPMHSVPAEADLGARLDALIALLVRNGVLSEEEYAEEVRRLLRARRG